MKQKKTKILTLLLTTALITTTIPSHASFWGRKYSEIKLSEDAYVINVRATGTSTPHKALSGLLTRAAELTLKNGYEYFVVVDNQDQSTDQYTPFYGTVYTQKVPHRQITIKCYKTHPGENMAIDARLFLENKK